MGAPRITADQKRHFGNKVKQGLKIAGTLKSMYDIGSTIYKGIQFAARIVAGLMLEQKRGFHYRWEHLCSILERNYDKEWPE